MVHVEWAAFSIHTQLHLRVRVRIARPMMQVRAGQQVAAQPRSSQAAFLQVQTRMPRLGADHGKGTAASSFDFVGDLSDRGFVLFFASSGVSYRGFPSIGSEVPPPHTENLITSHCTPSLSFLFRHRGLQHEGHSTRASVGACNLQLPDHGECGSRAFWGRQGGQGKLTHACTCIVGQLPALIPPFNTSRLCVRRGLPARRVAAAGERGTLAVAAAPKEASAAPKEVCVGGFGRALPSLRRQIPFAFCLARAFCCGQIGASCSAGSHPLL